MIRVFKSKPIIKSLTEQEQFELVEDFKSYKSGKLPDLFGKDVLYDHPLNPSSVLTEKVRHIHLASKDSVWPVWKVQFSRTSDEHLVYCQGAMDENCYLLMTILSPNAHDLAKNSQIMRRLGMMAEQFRQKF